MRDHLKLILIYFDFFPNIFPKNIIVVWRKYNFDRLFKSRLLKLGKTWNRYNSDNSYFDHWKRGTLPLSSAFLFISIRASVAEISSCKREGVFWSFSPIYPYKLWVTDAIPGKAYAIPRKRTSFLQEREI